MGCVYLVRNTVNGKGYVGKSINCMQARKKSHKYDVLHGSQWAFHCAIRKYNWDAFEWSILEEDDDDEFLCFMEQRWIKQLGTKVPNGYNMTDGGEGQSPGWTPTENQTRQFLEFARSPRTESHKEKIQKSLIGHQVSEETRRKISEALKGRKRSPESIEKTRKSLIGRQVSEETKKEDRRC